MLGQRGAGFAHECDILATAQRSWRFLYSGIGDSGMKFVGFLMLLAGWFLVMAAIVLFQAQPTRVAFVLVGVAVEVLGLILAFRSHLIPREEKR